MKSWKQTFIIIWSGQAISLLTSSIVQFAIIWWITKQTGSASTLAIATIAGIVPQIVLGPFIGVWVDRWDRKKIMILSDLGIGFFTLIIGGLFYLDIITVWQIYLLLAARSVGSSFHYPAMQSSIPLLAPEEQLPRIAGINQALFSIANIAGPALGALLFELLNMNIIVLIDTLGAIWACTTLAFVKIPKAPPVELHNNVLKDLKAALSTMYNNKGIFSLVIVWLIIIFFFVPVDSLFPLITSQYFGGDAVELSAVEIAFGIGMLLGGAAMGIWAKNHGLVKLFNSGIIALGICYLLAGLLSNDQFYIFVALVFAMGLSVPIFNSPTTSLFQIHIEPGMLGRIFSLMDTLCLLPVPIGLIFIGTLTDTIGINIIFIIAGVAIILTGIIAFFIKPLMNLNNK